MVEREEHEANLKYQQEASRKRQELQAALSAASEGLTVSGIPPSRRLEGKRRGADAAQYASLSRAVAGAMEFEMRDREAAVQVWRIAHATLPPSFFSALASYNPP